MRSHFFVGALVALSTLACRPGQTAAAATTPEVRRSEPGSTQVVAAAPDGARTGAPPAPAPVPQPGKRDAPPDADGSSGLSLFMPYEQDAPCKPITGKVRLNIEQAPIAKVIREASRWSCRNFAFTDEVARGEITVVSKDPVSSEEAYALLAAALHANNIAMYRSGKYYNLVRVTDAKKSPIPTLIDDGAAIPATVQPVTRVVRLKYAAADQMRRILLNFVSPSGSDIQAIPPDLLVITDIGLNLRRIERLIREIDQPGRDQQRWPDATATPEVAGVPEPDVATQR